MKKLALITLFFAQSLSFAMDAPDGWKPNRPSGSGRPRPTVVNYGTSPLPVATPSNSLPLPQSTAPSLSATDDIDTANWDAQMSRFMNPLNGQQKTQDSPSQLAVPEKNKKDKKEKKEKTKLPLSVAGITNKESDRLQKIEEDLEKIEDTFKEMGFDLAATALSAASLDPIGAAFAASNSVITIPKLTYYYGNMQKHIFFLSSNKTSPAAKARLAQLTPRLQKASRALAKGPESLKKLVAKFSKDTPKEAK